MAIKQVPGGAVRGDKAPLNYTVGAWPHEAEPIPDAPPGVRYSLALARALDDEAARQGLSHRTVSTNAGLNPTATGRIVRGELFPDLATLARLETSLGLDLLQAGRFRAPST